MKVFLAIFIVSFLDPIRWLACICGAWFIRSFFGALAIGVAIPFAFTVLFSGSQNPSFLLAGALTSVVIVTTFHSWRKSKRLKTSSSTLPEN